MPDHTPKLTHADGKRERVAMGHLTAHVDNHVQALRSTSAALDHARSRQSGLDGRLAEHQAAWSAALELPDELVGTATGRRAALLLGLDTEHFGPEGTVLPPEWLYGQVRTAVEGLLEARGGDSTDGVHAAAGRATIALACDDIRTAESVAATDHDTLIELVEFILWDHGCHKPTAPPATIVWPFSMDVIVRVARALQADRGTLTTVALAAHNVRTPDAGG